MKTIAISNQKGGVGKTTHANHLVHALLDNGLRVMLLDVDTQGNSSNFFSNAHCNISSDELYKKECDVAGLEAYIKNQLVVFPASGRLENVQRMKDENLVNLYENLQGFDAYFDYCVIDTPPAAGFVLKSVVYGSNYIYMPMEIKQWSIDGTILMLKTILGMSAEKEQVFPGTKTEFLGICINLYDKSDKNQPAALEMLKEQIGKFLMVGNQDAEDETTVQDVIKISQKNIIEYSQNIKMPVWKYNAAEGTRSKAATESAREWHLLYAYLFPRIGAVFNGLQTKIAAGGGENGA